MNDLQEVLSQIQLWEFVVVAVVAVISWLRHRGTARAWVALTFFMLASVVVVGRLMPEQPTTARDHTILKFLVVCLVLFPYLLFRFTATFRPFKIWAETAAAALTAAVAAGVFAFERLPRQGEARPPEFQLYVIALLLQWTVVSALVVGRLWTSGRGQPHVARRRMQTLALGTLALALALLVSGSSDPSTDFGGIQVFTAVLGIMSAPLFLFGFAPPRLAVAIWRRPEELALREAEKGLMGANSPEEVAEIVLPHAARLFGGRRAELRGKDGAVIASFLEPASNLASSEQQPISVEVGETTLVVEASAYAPFFGPEEADILGVLGTLTELALVRTRQAAELQAATEAMRDFVAIASHDLRTPITVIKGMGLSLASRWDQTPAETRDRQIEAIVRQAGALSRLVDDLLIVSRIESSAVEGAPEKVNVKRTIEHVLTDEGIEGFEVRVPETIEVIADQDHLIRMMSNYIKNATTYGGPPYLIEASVNGTSAEIAVVDHGKGVPEQFRPRLFEKFARADKQESKTHGGTGLGLSIVRGLARASGGDAWFTPVEPSGARFSLRLPTAQEDRWSA